MVDRVKCSDGVIRRRTVGGHWHRVTDRKRFEDNLAEWQENVRKQKQKSDTESSSQEPSGSEEF